MNNSSEEDEKKSEAAEPAKRQSYTGSYNMRGFFGHPYHILGRVKIERYHKTHYWELIALKEFRSLNHLKRKLWNFDHLNNNLHKQEILNWMSVILQ